MAHSHIVFKNPAYGSVKRAPVGFSWTTAFFGAFPALLRSDFKWFGIQFAIAIALGVFTVGIGAIISAIFFGFIYNKLYIQELVNKGYLVEKVESNLTLEQLSAETESALRPLTSGYSQTTNNFTQHNKSGIITSEEEKFYLQAAQEIDQGNARSGIMTKISLDESDPIRQRNEYIRQRVAQLIEQSRQERSKKIKNGIFVCPKCQSEVKPIKKLSFFTMSGYKHACPKCGHVFKLTVF